MNQATLATRHIPADEAATSLSIVIPVYNEGENIRAAIREIETKVRTPHCILIVYDRDDDNTVPVVQGMIKQRPHLRLLKNRFGRGALNAIKTGFDAVEQGVVLVMMADLADDPVVVDRMRRAVDDGYDVVCGSRYMKGGRQRGGSWLKKLLSRGAGVSLHYLAGLPTRDVTNSFKAYRAEVLRSVEVESDGGFELGMEIVVKAHLAGFRVTEVPSVWRDRTAGESRFQLRKWLPKYLYWYFYALRGSLRNSLFGIKQGGGSGTGHPPGRVRDRSAA